MATSVRVAQLDSASASEALLAIFGDGPNSRYLPCFIGYSALLARHAKRPVTPRNVRVAVVITTAHSAVGLLPFAHRVGP